MSYSSYDHDDLEPASTMRIERRIYFESGKADLSEMVKLPLQKKMYRFLYLYNLSKCLLQYMLYEESD